MRLGRASALGVFAALHLADHADEAPIQAREIAGALGVPNDYLIKILQQLVRARILTSVRGPTGGFRLAKRPSGIQLLSIVEAIDGPLDGALGVRQEVQGQAKAKHQIEITCEEIASYARSLLTETSIQDLQEKSRRGSA